MTIATEALQTLGEAARTGDAPIAILPGRVAELIAGRAPSHADLRALGAWNTRAMLRAEPARTASVAADLVAIDPSEWSPEQLGSIVAILRSDAGQGVMQLPSSIPGARDLERVALTARPGDEASFETLRRYSDAWRSALAGRGGTGTESPLSELLADGDIASWPVERWRGIGAAVDASRDPATSHLRAIEGLEPFSVVAAQAAHGDVGPAAHRYVAAWRASADPELGDPSLRRSAARTMLERSPDLLQAAEWQRLAALIDIDTDRAIRSSASLSGDLPDLADLASRHASGVAVAADTRRAFAAWGVVADGTASDPVRMIAEMRDLVGRAATEPARADLQRIGALLDVDSAAATLQGPRELPGAGDFGTVARELARRPTRDSTSLQRYAEAWSRYLDGAGTDADSIRDGVRRLVALEPSTLGPDDWRRLATLIDLDEAGDVLRLPSSFGDGEPLAALAARASRGLPVPQRQLARTFAAWRIGLDPGNDAGVLQRRVREIVEQRDQLRPEQWRELAAIIDLGTERSGVRVPAIAEVGDTFQHELRDLAFSTRPPSGATKRVLEAWRLQYELGGGADAVRARLLELLSPPDGKMDVGRWQGVRAIFDLAGEEIDGVSLEATDSKQLLQLAAESFGGVREVRTIDDAVIDRWRHALDPSIVSDRRRAIRAAMDGGQLPEGLTRSELRDLDPRWASRTPFERLAVEAATGAMSGTTHTSAQLLVEAFQAIDHAPANMPDSLVDLWRQTKRLVDVNGQRMRGSTPLGEVRGYGTYPDFAQIGRIRANIELIRRMTPPTIPVSVPADGTGATGAAHDLLGW